MRWSGKCVQIPPPLLRRPRVGGAFLLSGSGSAYAVMLRAIGIPSVVVNGYAGGEWNPYGNYFLVRQSDAEAWRDSKMRKETPTLKSMLADITAKVRKERSA